MPDTASPNESLYEEFLAEREEVLRHKWLMSERAGVDVGFESALIDWTLSCRSDWKKKRSKRKRKADPGS